MTIQAISRKVSYAGNNSTSTYYSIPFQYLDDTSLIDVVVVDSDGVETELTPVTDFTVSVGNGVLTVAAWDSTYTLTISRTVPLSQLTDYVTAGSFPAETHERALDKLTMICQELSEQIGRTIRVTIGSDDLDEIEAAEANSRFFGIDSDGTTKALTVAEALALLSLEGSITPNPTTFWTNDAARALKIPDFESQVGVQMDTDEVWVSTGTSAGNWVQLQYFSGVMQAPNQTAAAADNLLTRSLGDARYLAAVKTTLVTASDSAWAFDSKTVFAEVSAVGGGGGGGGALSSLAANATAGNGGAAGAYGRKIWDVSALTIRTLNITIGAGGAGGTSGGNDGSNGGTTTVIDGDSSVTLTAPGGEAGAGDSNGTSLTQFRQSSGGEKIATGGDVNLPNQNGEGGFYQGTGIASALLAKGGTGGNSPYGRGGKGAQERGTSGANSDGVDGAGYGAGGGGGASIANGGSGLGGDGMGGVVEVKEYMLI